MTRACLADRVVPLVLLAAVLAGCPAHAPPVPDPPAPAPCLDEAPPAERTWALAPGCPTGLVCLTDADARALAGEIEGRRLWDARAWERCGTRPEPPP